MITPEAYARRDIERDCEGWQSFKNVHSAEPVPSQAPRAGHDSVRLIFLIARIARNRKVRERYLWRPVHRPRLLYLRRMWRGSRELFFTLVKG